MTMDPGIGPRYQESTKYYRRRMSPPPAWIAPVPPYKTYDNPLRHIDLPEPQLQAGPDLWNTIAQRRSRRRFGDHPMSLHQLAQLIWAVQGITTGESDSALRATASAGALYPNETYLFVSNVTDCPAGIYHYEVLEARLATLAEGDFSIELAQACLDQRFCADAGVVFAWGAVVPRCAQKYADRAYRYIYMDAGHLGAHLQLAATALDLAGVNIGAFYDEEVNRLLGLDGSAETVVYLAAVGTLPDA
jgi:SagB-type dehydrogenase family enzyme